jgi:hypothetical protein
MSTLNGTTFLAKIFNLVGTSVPSGTTYTSNQWKNYFEEGARDVVYRSVKTDVELIKSLITEFSVSGNDYTIADDSVQTVLSVMRDDYKCTEVPKDRYKWYSDQANNGGIYEASALHPIYTIDNRTAGNSVIKTLPASATTVSVQKIDYTSIDGADLNTSESINGVSPQLANLIILFTAIRILNDNIVSQTDAIVTLAGTIETALNTYLGDGTMRDALDNAKALIDSKAKDHSSANAVVTTDAFEWIDDEDSEMIQAVMMVAQQEVSRAGVELSSQLESVKLATQKLSVLREKLTIYNVRKQELQQEYYGYFGQQIKQPPQQQEEK